MAYDAATNRYDGAKFRRTGNSGLMLPLLSLGLWHNFGDSTPIDRQRAMLRAAFDRCVTHFDLANNYGPPYGSAEVNFGHIFREDFRPYRDELIISTKAGWDMWPGPYGQGGGSRKYVLASLDQSLERMGLDYVDIFYSHRFDATTPLEETAAALASAVQQGKALYIGLSSYSAGKTREMAKLLAEWKVPLLIHQPSYNMFNRWIEAELIDACAEVGAGIIVFTALAQGLLTDRDLNEIARKRGQSLAQMALAWVLRDSRVTSAVIGASSPAQINENLDALKNLSFSAEELAEIDKYAVEGGINLWEKPSTDQEVVPGKFTDA